MVGAGSSGCFILEDAICDVLGEGSSCLSGNRGYYDTYYGYGYGYGYGYDDQGSGNCSGSGQIEDCNGECYPAAWIGDSECEDGSWGGADFDCSEFDWDGGDCGSASGSGSGGSGSGGSGSGSSGSGGSGSGSSGSGGSGSGGSGSGGSGSDTTEVDVSTQPGCSYNAVAPYRMCAAFIGTAWGTEYAYEGSCASFDPGGTGTNVTRCPTGAIRLCDAPSLSGYPNTEREWYLYDSDSAAWDYFDSLCDTLGGTAWP